MDLAPLFRKRSVPSLLDNLSDGPLYLAIWFPYTLRFFEGRQPLWGNGVTSVILLIFKPHEFNDLIADSLPPPGPLTFTSKFIIPNSFAALPAFSAAIWAAKGVLFLEPRKPEPPEVAQHTALPCLSVIVMIVLLNDACICAIPVSYTHLTLPTKA